MVHALSSNSRRELRFLVCGSVDDGKSTLFPADRFLEVHVDAPIEICRQRDLKGLYRASDSGKVTNVTGRDQPYEPPMAAHITVKTAEILPETAVELLLETVSTRL
ncbi:MAG: adenylyl-sulfate kinase [Enhydrobacter sp.]|nr:MAG: adenylyl-sulfate kinase [Enhydrobacter sp.]